MCVHPWNVGALRQRATSLFCCSHTLTPQPPSPRKMFDKNSGLLLDKIQIDINLHKIKIDSYGSNMTTIIPNTLWMSQPTFLT